MRKALSAPELRLWMVLKPRMPGRPAFRRQHPMGPYILDFYCAKAKVAVEVDGASHDERIAHDARRDAWLSAQGQEVMRFSARDVMGDVNAVADAIWKRVEARVG
jgi:very-short-patch-repair endonuclease